MQVLDPRIQFLRVRILGNAIDADRHVLADSLERAMQRSFIDQWASVRNCN
ncbi:hypothetical protein [Sandaracinus amylolyticus]|uniref:hypothetical protein n=1 Tax=Sandaracinus amylolyticus TaxID=927083 RepID=UPI001F0A120A|nr:hypothetical protein [Sandaracinus amylolyticus]